MYSTCIKSPETMEAEMQQQQAMADSASQLLGQAGQTSWSPLMDPSKNPEG